MIAGVINITCGQTPKWCIGSKDKLEGRARGTRNGGEKERGGTLALANCSDLFYSEVFDSTSTRLPVH